MAKLVFDPVHQLAYSEKVFQDELSDMARIPESYTQSFVIVTSTRKPLAIQLVDDPVAPEKTVAGPAYPTQIAYATFFSEAAARSIAFAFNAAGQQGEFIPANAHTLIEDRRAEITKELLNLAELRQSLNLGQPDWAAVTGR